MDESVRKLSMTGRWTAIRLQKAEINAMTFMLMLSHNPKLKTISIRRMLAVTRRDEAIAVVRSISAVSPIGVEVRIRCDQNRRIWMSNGVQEALNELKELDGHEIVFSANRP